LEFLGFAAAHRRVPACGNDNFRDRILPGGHFLFPFPFYPGPSFFRLGYNMGVKWTFVERTLKEARRSLFLINVVVVF
jgi:hypothetical protein